MDEFRKLREQPDSGAYKIVDDEEEMIQLLEEGWELVRKLNSEKFLMREK